MKRLKEKRFPPDDSESRSRRMLHLRMIVAIPALTTFLVLGLGLALVELQRRQLLTSRPWATLVDAQRAMSDIALAIVIAAAGALLAGIILAAAVTRPFRELERKTRGMAAGDLTGRVQFGIGAEFHELADAYNRMAASLNDFFMKGGGGTLTVDCEGRIAAVSGDVAELLECDAQNLVGRRFEEVFPGDETNAEFRGRVLEGLERREPQPACEMTLAGRSGREMPVSVSVSLLRDMRHPTQGVLVKIDDVTDVKRVREQMRRIDRLTALCGLAAGVAHQVRNPLCSIRGFAQLMGEDADRDEATRGAAAEIIRNADRINAAIISLLESLRPGTPEWNYSRVDEVVRDTMMKGRAAEPAEKEVQRDAAS